MESIPIMYLKDKLGGRLHVIFLNKSGNLRRFPLASNHGKTTHNRFKCVKMNLQPMGLGFSYLNKVVNPVFAYYHG